MERFGFTDILQMQYVELQPNSVLPIHMDDFTYEDGKDIIAGPTPVVLCAVREFSRHKIQIQKRRYAGCQ